MARPIIHSPRVLRTGQPLTLDAIKEVAPAVFAETPHSSRGPKYAYVPTITPLQTLMANGWGVYEASQQRARAQDRDPYTKHMLRLRKLGMWEPKEDGVPEVILINAHDGTAAYHLFAGYFKFICSNGLIVGQTLAGFKVRHSVGPQTSIEVLAAGEKTVTEKFPIMLDSIAKMRTTEVDQEATDHLCAVALKLRYGSTLPPYPASDLMLLRREEDKDPTLWNMLNRIQENITTGGWETRSMLHGRRSRAKPVEQVSAVAHINAGLWDEAIHILGGV